MLSTTPVLIETMTLTGAVTAHRFVGHDGAQAGADANAAGVALASGVAGERIPVVTLGVVEVEAGGAIAVGATVKADAQGRAITWASSGARLGVARAAASGAGARIPIFLIPQAA